MCKASVMARSTVQAVVGQLVTIGINPRHEFGVFHEAGVAPDDRVVCVKNGQRLTLSDIPIDLQQKFGVNETTHATFREEDDNQFDQLEFGNGKRADLHDFGGYGIIAYIGEMDLTGNPRSVGASDNPRELEPA